MYYLIVYRGLFKEKINKRSHLLVRSGNVQSERQTKTNLADVPLNSRKDHRGHERFRRETVCQVKIFSVRQDRHNASDK